MDSGQRSRRKEPDTTDTPASVEHQADGRGRCNRRAQSPKANSSRSRGHRGVERKKIRTNGMRSDRAGRMRQAEWPFAGRGRSEPVTLATLHPSMALSARPSQHSPNCPPRRVDKETKQGSLSTSIGGFVGPPARYRWLGPSRSRLRIGRPPWPISPLGTRWPQGIGGQPERHDRHERASWPCPCPWP